MDLETQKFLRNNPINKIKEIYNIDYTRHPKFQNVVLFSYGIESPMAEIISRECRGLILDESKNWEIVAFPFIKFFNYTEGHAAKIDWNSAIIQEKLDGSMVNLYCLPIGEWEFATTGSPDASGQVNDFPFTFNQLFRTAFLDQNLNYPTNKDLTILFEYTAKYNAQVVKHKEPKLTVIGGRNKVTHRELRPEEAATIVNGEAVKTFLFHTLNEVIKTAHELNGSHQEGYVVCDKNFNRIKIKAQDYVAKHQLKSSWSTRNAVKLVLSGKYEVSEVIGYFPEFTQELTIIQNAINNLCKQLDDIWQQIKNISDRKIFALTIKDIPGKFFLFQKRDGKINTFLEGLRNTQIDTVIDLLDLKNLSTNMAKF